MRAKIVLPGRPVPKKNNSVMVAKRNLILPSKAYREYEKQCCNILAFSYRGPKFFGPVRLTARYWLPDRRWWPDLVGLLQATQDILQKAKVIDNDQKVVRVDGSEIAGLDKGNPRAEIEIEEV